MDGFITEFWVKFSADILGMGKKILIAALIISGGKIILFAGRRILNRAGKGKVKLDETVISILQIILNYAVIIICVIMILEDFGFNTTGLIALLGTAGVAIGFALKDSLSNIAFGIIIIFLKPFKKGDFIEFSSNMGTVKEIGLFTTEIETFDGVFISAPNSNLWGTPLKNYSKSSKRRMEITFRISFNDSIDAAFRIFQDFVEEEKKFLAEPAPAIVVQSLGDYGINISLRAWAASSDYWTVYWDIMRKLKDRIDAAGLNIPVPGREIKMIQ